MAGLNNLNKKDELHLTVNCQWLYSIMYLLGRWRCVDRYCLRYRFTRSTWDLRHGCYR